MISLADARSFVLDRVTPLDPKQVRVEDSVGLVLAESVKSPVNVPPFDNSAMDGFAVRSSDVNGPGVELDVIGTIPAGSVPQHELGEGQAYRIMTGAMMPKGSDTVAMVEICKQDVTGDRVTISEAIEPGRHVRRAGDDSKPGDAVLSESTVITPSVIGLLATYGIDKVLAYPKPVVGVFSTGDELVSPPAELKEGQIYDSNRVALIATLRSEGFETVDLGLISDDEALILAAIIDGASRCDVLVTSGGVSMGDFDYVKTVLDEIGDMEWMQVAIKPAKPLAFGTVLYDGREVPVFGLPGNPVSSLVSFEVFARPALRSMASNPVIERWLVTAKLTNDLKRRDDGKVHFARVTLSDPDEEGVVWAEGLRGQGSHQMASMALANGLAVLPPGEGSLAGEFVDVMPI